MGTLIDSFSRTLEPLLKEEELPREVVGDLDDLLGTAEKLCGALRDIARNEEQLPKDELKAMLFTVQVMIEQDLPMIVADLLPPLRELSAENLSEEAD